MPAEDKIHDAIKNALIRDGWTITADPYKITYEGDNLYIDLSAERPIAAKRGTEEIVIEIKSFLSPSVMRDLQQALGQYILYRTILTEIAPEKRLYLAVRDTTYERLQVKPVFTLIQSQSHLQIIVVNTEQEEIVQWID